MNVFKLVGIKGEFCINLSEVEYAFRSADIIWISFKSKSYLEIEISSGTQNQFINMISQMRIIV